ncbi:uncharacterized protein LOC134540873 [Bacillus rossius redtenbacheri]|uniref:uncharacterized protein LOC134540873 n=1 Tax=Bacillus rossius redtenbacheri TaxID=93214 RepID=UPI002FDE0094
MKPALKDKVRPDQEDPEKIIESDLNHLSPSCAKTKVNTTASDYRRATEKLSSHSGDVLEASRRWRAMYHEFREKNRAKWEAEEMTSLEHLPNKEEEGETKTAATEKDKTAGATSSADDCFISNKPRLPCRS